MRNALFFVLSGAAGALIFDAVLSPFFGAALSEFGVRPEDWGSATARAIVDILTSQTLHIALAGAAGAYFGVFTKWLFFRFRR